MDTTGSQTPLQPQRHNTSQPYMQLALYLAGNALTVIIGLLIWNLNTVLADFRDSMLYALLCSIALRPIKDWLVHTLDRSLSDKRRSVAWALLCLLALPLTALVDAVKEGRAILAKWRLAVQEEFQRRQGALKRAADEVATPPSPSTPRTAPVAAATAAKATAMQTMPSLAVYGHAAVKVLKSRRTSKKRRKQRQLLLKRGPEGSNVLFRWLFRILAAWLLWEWVRDSWSTTVQLVLLVGTAVLALGLVPLLLLLTTNQFLGTTMFSPVKPPTAPSTQKSAQRQKRRASLHSVSPPKRPCFTPLPDCRHGREARRAGAGDSGEPGGTGQTADLWGWCQGSWQAVKGACRSIYLSLESSLRSTLRANLHALAAIILIAGLFVGTTGLAAFLSVRVAQEGRSTVLAVRDVFPAAWAGMAASTPLLADAVADASSASQHEHNGSRGGQLPTAVLPAWVALYQKEALQLVQQALPAVARWGERQFYGFVDKQNLTSALGDIRLLYDTMQGPQWCNERKREKLVVALARAEVALQAARNTKQQAAQQLGHCRKDLQDTVARLDKARSSAPHLGPATAPAECLPPSADDSYGGSSECQTGQEPPLDEQVLRLGERVVAADAALMDAKQQHKAAAMHLDAVEREQRSAASRLQLCSAEKAGGQQSSLLPGLAGEVGAGLQQAYSKLWQHLWRRQFREGLADMRQAAGHCIAALRGIKQRSNAAVADLSSLQQLVQAAADPLIAAGRVLGRLFAGSLGSTTAAALMGGLGVLRLGMGVVKFGMQLMLFLALLYYLLAAQADPLLAAVGVLPLSEVGRQRAAVALNRALGGVLASSIKLSAFHGCFSWITFRVMNLPLTYTASVTSAVCALLPFVPIYAVALPGCVVLLAQGRLLAALLFFALHFVGYYIGDTIILEDIPGGHPYMLSLGILGGIYAFENPVQGCLLGPILLSLLSVFYNLHSEFMGGSGSGTLAPDGRPLHRLWSVTPGARNSEQQQEQQQEEEQQQAQQQRQHGWLGVPAASRGAGRTAGALGELGAGLRVSVPGRGHAAHVPGFSPEQRTFGEEEAEATPTSQQQQQRQPRQSLSLSLADRSLGSQQSTAAGAAAAAGSESGEEEEEEEEAAEAGSPSVGNSFSFGTPLDTAASSKLHGD